MRLQGDLVPALLGAARGDLSATKVAVDPRAAVGVVMAAEGYPGRVTVGDAIEGAEGPFPPGSRSSRPGPGAGRTGGS